MSLKFTKSILASLSVLAVASLITGCLPGNTIGKVSGTTKLRNVASSISGFGRASTIESTNSRVDVTLDVNALEPFAGITGAPALQSAAFPNAVGTVRLNDKTLNFGYQGTVMFCDLITSNTAANVTLPAQVQAELSRNHAQVQPDFEERMNRSIRPFQRIGEYHERCGARFNGVILNVGHGRPVACQSDDDRKPNQAPTTTCGTYFVSVTVQTTVDLPENILSDFTILPFPSPAIPAGSTLELFITFGTCGYYETVGVTEKSKIRADVTVVTPPTP